MKDNHSGTASCTRLQTRCFAVQVRVENRRFTLLKFNMLDTHNSYFCKGMKELFFSNYHVLRFLLYMCIYLEPQWPLFLSVNPWKQGLFPSKTMGIWVPGMHIWALICQISWKVWASGMLDSDSISPVEWVEWAETSPKLAWDFAWGGGFMFFHPYIPGEMIQFDEHIFQMGGSTTN